MSPDFPGWEKLGGAEHDVRFDPLAKRWWKYTNAGFAGLTVDWDGGLSPTLRMATPCEYLKRLIAQNQIFSDDIRFEGLWWDADSHDWRIVTSQPDVIGEPAGFADITSLMISLGFILLPLQGVGRAGALAFRRDHSVIWDAHPANYFKTAENVVVPIDVIVTSTPPANR